jgi:hypothetical protein
VPPEAMIWFAFQMPDEIFPLEAKARYLDKFAEIFRKVIFNAKECQVLC